MMGLNPLVFRGADQTYGPPAFVQRSTGRPKGRIHSVVDLRHPDGKPCDECLVGRWQRARQEYERRRRRVEPKPAYRVGTVVVPVPRKLSITDFEVEPDLSSVPPDQTLTVERWSDGTFRLRGHNKHLEPCTRSVSPQLFARDPYAAAHWLHYGVWP